MVALSALGGLIVAVVVKYADNILKGFATAFSLVVAVISSYALFPGYSATSLFFAGAVRLVISIIKCYILISVSL